MNTQELVVTVSLVALSLVAGNALLDTLNQPEVKTQATQSNCISINQRVLGISSPEAMSHIESACK